MKIVAVTACTAGIAHTYIVAEKIKNAAEEAGHWVKVETQGSTGVENEITREEAQAADVVIYAHDIAIRGTSRFEGKKNCGYPNFSSFKES